MEWIQSAITLVSGAIALWVMIERFWLEKRRAKREDAAAAVETDKSAKQEDRQNWIELFNENKQLLERHEQDAEKYRQLYLQAEERAEEAERRARKAERQVAELTQKIKAFEERLQALEGPNKVLVHEHIYTTLWNDSTAGWALVDFAGRVMQGNDRLHELLKYSPGALVGKDFRTITHNDYVAIDSEYFAGLVEGAREHYAIEKKYKTEDRKYYVLLRLDVYRLEGENFVLGKLSMMDGYDESTYIEAV